jgi:hypothetical protein
MKLQLIQLVTFCSISLFVLNNVLLIWSPLYKYEVNDPMKLEKGNNSEHLKDSTQLPSSNTCPDLNMSSLLLPIVINGFNNQINGLFHGVLIAEMLGRTMVEPQFYAHESCTSSKKSYAFADTLQWSEDFKANHQTLSFQTLKNWIACEIETDIVHSKFGYDVLQQIYRVEQDLNVKFVRVRVEELVRGFLNITNFFENNGIARSPRLVLSVGYATVKGFHGRPYGKNPVVVDEILTSLKFSETSLNQARDVLETNHFSQNLCFIHFRPFADECVKTWPGQGSEKVCSNLDTLTSLLEKNGLNSSVGRDCDHYVAHPEFLSKEGQLAVKQRIQPKMTTADLAAKYPHLDCFELSLLEQSIALLSNNFQGSGESSWTDTINIFRKMKNI